jgi:predicted acylesterase/phospholipase RssA
MTIKHLVISGGGPTGFYTYGAAKFLSEKKYWDINDIETIYSTSIGAYIGTLFCLKYDWETLDDYVIKRPWDKLFNISPESIFKMWETKGLFGDECIKESFKPLLIAKELDINVTLKEFYEYSKIELHMFAVDINDFPLKETDISYKTHPDLSLVTALTMTTAIPFVYKPVIIDEMCFLDGGLVLNYPLKKCLDDTKCDESEILAFKNYYSTEKKNVKNLSIIKEDTTLLNFWVYLMKLFIKHFNDNHVETIISNEVKCFVDDLGNIEDWKRTLEDKEFREKFIKKGEAAGFMFLEYKISLQGR